ncbi:MAG: aryl-sulfate sulfotransferase [Chloroflexota bacterium]
MRNLRLLVFVLLLIGTGVVFAQDETQERTVGALYGEHSGYTLSTPNGNPFVFLLNDQGEVVHQWFTEDRNDDVILLEDGSILVNQPRLTVPEFDFGADITWLQGVGSVGKYNWDGELVWRWELGREGYRLHHGLELMPNGNLLLIAFEYRTTEEAIQAGRNPETLGDGLWSEVFMELDTETLEIVWEWVLWDHLIQDFDETKDNYGVVEDNPQLVDINYWEPQNPVIEDWVHVNSLDFNPELNQIAVSAREFNEIWVIPYTETSEEAATEAGNLLYRWGNPRAYGQGTEADQELFFQHDVQWIPEGYPGAGNMLTYSNRNLDETLEEGEFSRVIEIMPPLLEDGTYELSEDGVYGPFELTWFYEGNPRTELYSRITSGAQRLLNGNTLITEGFQGRLLEVTSEGEIVWEYIIPYSGAEIIPQGGNARALTFRARRFELDFPAFEGRDLTPLYTVESLAEVEPEAEATEDAGE